MSNRENFQIQVHSRLNEENVKLWLEPYFHQDSGPNLDELKNLAERFAKDLKIPLESCQIALLDLQSNALKKLDAKRVFEASGVACFALKVCKSQAPPENNKSVNCQLDQLGSVLLEVICKELGEPDGSNIKVICTGKVLDTQLTLREQGITKFHNQLMVMISQNTSSSKQSNTESMYQRIERVKKDVETIVKNNHHNHFQMEDQDGNAIYLPPSENQAVIKALAFFEKGKAAMKRQNYEEALILLLEADQQFSTCQSKILESVDNYAYLNIDIVWCYLCLKNVSQAPDAKRRLDLTEKTLKKSYGENMNRVMHLKGNAVNEKAIFARLHLLQGILMFHENKRADALQKIGQAENAIRALKVDEQQLNCLMEMGYETTESRIALRSCQNDVTSAIQFIIDRRNKRKVAREKSKMERASLRKAGGQNDKDNKWVNPRSVHSLVEMGFPENLSAAALRKTENNVSAALDILQTNPDSLIDEISHNTIDQNLIDEMTKMGFPRELAKIALENVQNDPQKALDFLLQMQGEGSVDDLFEKLAGQSSSLGVNAGASTSTFRQLHESSKAYDRFVEDIDFVDEEHLDLPLEEEEELIAQYKSLLEQ